MLININKSSHFSKSIDEISKEVHISIDLLKNICKYYNISKIICNF